MTTPSIPVVDQPSVDPQTLQINSAIREQQDILNGNIGNDNIADGAINLAKLESGAWDTYTPVLTTDGASNPTGYSIDGRYTVQGQNTCHLYVGWEFGATVGAGNYFCTIPVNLVRGTVGTGYFYDASTGRRYSLVPVMWTPTTFLCLVLSINFGASTYNQAPFNNTVPVTVAVGDIVVIAFTYETQ